MTRRTDAARRNAPDWLRLETVAPVRTCGDCGARMTDDLFGQDQWTVRHRGAFVVVDVCGECSKRPDVPVRFDRPRSRFR